MTEISKKFSYLNMYNFMNKSFLTSVLLHHSTINGNISQSPQNQHTPFMHTNIPASVFDNTPIHMNLELTHILDITPTQIQNPTHNYTCVLPFNFVHDAAKTIEQNTTPNHIQNSISNLTETHVLDPDHNSTHDSNIPSIT